MADETLDDIRGKQLSLGELLTRVLRRLHDEFHEQWDAKEEEGGDHEAKESDKERQAESKRALELLGVLYPDLTLTAKHKPAEDYDEKKADNKAADSNDEEEE